MGGFLSYLVRAAKLAVIFYAGVSIMLIYLLARDGAAAALNDPTLRVAIWATPLVSALIAIGSEKSE